MAATVVTRERIRPRTRASRDGTVDTTLLALVEAIAEVTDDEREIVATVIELLRSGRVRLVGNFRGETLGDS